jgi:hypothetical protein
MFLLSIDLIPVTYKNTSWRPVLKKPSICWADIPPYGSTTYIVGKLSFGKMSIGIFTRLMIENISSPRHTTIIVTGRARAIFTRFIIIVLAFAA